MPPFRPFRHCLLPLAMAVAPFAGAQEPGETIEVQGQRREGSSRAPEAASTVIDTAQFGGELRSVAEMLLSAPGVAIHALGGPGQAATLSLRGASADQSVVLLDGIPLQGPGGGAVDLSSLPSTLVDRLVVSRGVLGAQFGAGALGGALELLPRSTRTTWTGGAEASMGSFGTARLALDAAMPLGRSGSAVIALQGDRTSGDFDYARQLTPDIPGSPEYGFTRQNADATRGSGLLRVSQELGGDLGLDLLLQASAGVRGLPGPSSAPTPRSRELDRGEVGGARLRGLAGDVAWSLRASGRLDDVELRGVRAFGDCADGAPDCPRDQQRSSAALAEGELSLPAGEANTARLLVSGGGEWVRGATGPHERGVLSAAVRDDAALPAGFSLHPAVRFDKLGRDSGVSPGVTAGWKPAADHPLSLRAGWGLSFRAPTFSELYLERGGIAPNSDLRPERAWSVEVGAEWRLARLTLSGGLFWSAYRDLILYQLFPPARVKPFNVGEARIAGLELQAIFPLPARLLATVSYSFLDAVNRADGHTLAYRPPHRVFARLARQGVRVEGYGEASFTSPMPRNAFDTAFVESQLLLNAGLGVRAAGPLWIDVEAKNLLDRRTYEDVFQYPLPGLSIAVLARARL